MCNNTNKTHFWSFEDETAKVFITITGLIFTFILCIGLILTVYHGYLASTGLQQCQAFGTSDIVWQKECVSKAIGEKQ